MSKYEANRKQNVYPQGNVIFTQYITYNDGEVEFLKPKPKCGDLWMCDLGDQESGVQGGYRPVFVISNNKNNVYSPTVNVLPLTTKMNKRRLPVHVEIHDYKKYGLEAPSTVLAEQITTIQTDRLNRKIGNIADANLLMEIYKAMTVQLPIMQLGSANEL